MKTIDFENYSRFFAFGCSFTDYWWPTWANIISKEIPNHYIYAKSGAGNFFIYQALIEATIKHKINKNDLVMIMFSNITREDKFVKNRGWITPGNLYFQEEYDDKFLQQFLCHHGYLMRDLNLVHGCKTILDFIGCDYELMSMVPFHSEHSNEKLIDDVDYILNFYKDTVSAVKPSVLTTIFNNSWESKPNRPTYSVSWSKNLYRDNHPTPSEHLEYLSFIYPNIKFSEDTLKFVKEADTFTRSTNFSIEKMDQQYSKNICSRLGIDKMI
jgi:hypothetical protein